MLVEETLFGRRDKVQVAIDRLRAFEPTEGYYLAFSGGKDSQAVYHLCREAGVKFDAHYSLKWHCGQDVMDWWLSENSHSVPENQITFEDISAEGVDL